MATSAPEEQTCPVVAPVSNDDVPLCQENTSVQDEECHDSSSVYSEATDVSVSSTVEYEHEPYESFRHKVSQLILDLFPDSTTQDIETERMEGGSFNRIIGVTIYKPEEKAKMFSMKTLRKLIAKICTIRAAKQARPSKRYVLRIPRESAAEMNYDVATLEYVARHMQCPVPKVIFYDMTGNNGLEQGYMLQRRLPGMPLHQLWKTLNIEQKQCASRRITKLLLDLHNITSNSAGIVSPVNTTLDLLTEVKLEQCQLGFNQKDGNMSLPQTTLQWILTTCERWNLIDDKVDGKCWHGMWDKFAQMAKKLHELGFLPDTDAFHLCHLDLQPRNLLAVVRDSTTIEVTGLLDWDTAAFVPKFVGLQAPFFLWNDEDLDEDDESLALTVPTEPELLELKTVYERVAGAEALLYAYTPEYVIARGMFQLLRGGIRSSYYLTLAQDLVREFEGLHPLAE